MLYNFLFQNQKEILAMTEKKTLELAGVRPSSEQLREGLPIFYEQLIEVLRLQGSPRSSLGTKQRKDGRSGQRV